MAGIYLHIPFCRKACHYCDFHFSTVLKGKDDLLEAMHIELERRRDYLLQKKVNTIYFGGGTPSLLQGDELNKLLDHIMKLNEVDPHAEITLEANPDDLTREKIRELVASPINRLSIGIQSFRDEDLKWMNRAHHASQSDYAVKAAQDAGFENITIDLIYSIPGMQMQHWKENLRQAVELNIQHISAYSLTIESGTFFGHEEKKGTLRPVEQEISSDQFHYMVEFLRENGFDQYEVSNFAKKGYESKHNTSYWEGKNYLGIGPSAHSFDGKSRQWNVSNNALYTRAIMKGESFFEREELDDYTQLNEYIMTGLRTKKGINMDFIHDKFGIDMQKIYQDYIEEKIKSKKMTRENAQLSLTTDGFLMADRIASDLFIIRES